MSSRIGRISARLLGARSIVTLVTILVLALVVLSPFGLREVSRLPGMSWASLSNVGQTYGGVSALLTALALVGVVLSLLYQARDVSIAREHSHRDIHNALMRMQLEDPAFMEVLSSWESKSDYDALRQDVFVHMWIMFWLSGFRLHELSEPELRFYASVELFNARPGRDYWSERRPYMEPYAPGKRDRKCFTDKRDRKFYKILDEEYEKAVAKGPPRGVSLSRNTQDRADRSSQEFLSSGGRLMVYIAAGVAMGHLIGDGLKRHIRY